jgi:hypothetical protein
MDLYRAKPGDLNREQLADALVLADTTCALLLDATDRSRLDGRQPAPASLQHPEVHQATGMIIVQLGGVRGGGAGPVTRLCVRPRAATA